MTLNPQEFERLKKIVSTRKQLGQKFSQQEDTSNPNYLERLKEGFVKESLDIGQGVKRGAELMGEGRVDEGSIRAGLAGAGGFARIAFSPITEALSPIISPLIEKITSNDQVQKVIQGIDSWAKQHPDAATNLKNVIDVGTLVAGAKGARVGVGGIENIGSKTTSKIGGSLKEMGKSSYGITITPQEATVRAMVAYDKTQPTLLKRLFGTKNIGNKPITEAETAARAGLAGTEYQIGVQSAKIGDELFKTKIKPKLDVAKNATNMKTLISNVEKKIAKVDDIARRNDLKEALEAFRQDYKNVSNISGTKLQAYKEGWAKFLPDKVWKGKPIASSYREIQDMMANEARPILYDIVGNEGKTAYIDYGNLKSITEAGIKSKLADPAKRSIFRNVWQAIMDKAITPVATYGGKVLYKTGEGLEFIGNKGLKRVGDIIEETSKNP